MSKTKVHNLIILDESGSMSSIKPLIMNGFNQTISTIKEAQQTYPDQQHTISMISFNGFGNKVLHFCEPIAEVKEIDAKRYVPAASTPLYDAIGFAVNILKRVSCQEPDAHVLVTILTDGAENASTAYSVIDIQHIVKRLQESNWTFTYIGTDHDVAQAAEDIAVSSNILFKKHPAAIKEMFQEEDKERRSFYKRLFDRLVRSDEFNADNNIDDQFLQNKKD
ncbi:vWA domain-containing protein [Sphingobacterium thalpophilum]|uniref:vWA domain-containing protein n=1 Tax=Sphingobacterium thalpophilum TaxID=259 RepID=UPI003DA6AA31